jgi:hypothetical protein
VAQRLAVMLRAGKIAGGGVILSALGVLATWFAHHWR